MEIPEKPGDTKLYNDDDDAATVGKYLISIPNSVRKNNECNYMLRPKKHANLLSTLCSDVWEWPHVVKSADLALVVFLIKQIENNTC